MAAMPAAAQTESTLRILDVRLGSPAIIGRDSSVVVEAVDSRAPVSGMVVRFGTRRDVFGISACRLPDSQTGALPRAFRPGARVRMTAPRRFRKGGMHKLLVRVDSGGCYSPLSSLFQPIVVTPTQPGKPRRPLEVGPPSLVEPPGLPPILPPPMPQPSMPTLPNLGDLPVAQARRRGCPGSGKRVGHSRASVRRARRALMCLLNKTRRRYGLSRLRANPRLLRAAERHSSSMVLRHFFSHVAPGGVSPLDRILGTGYLSGSNGFVYGENIGFGEGPASRPRHMMRAWMHSTPHRVNILTRSFREVGLGVVPGIPGRASAGGGTYTTVFGVRR